MTILRKCFRCNAQLTPFDETTWTAHEFKCGKLAPYMIPEQWRAKHEADLIGERRSMAAKRGVETRRRNGGKRAPRR